MTAMSKAKSGARNEARSRRLLVIGLASLLLRRIEISTNGRSR